MGQTFAIQCIAQFAGSTAIQTGHPGMYVLVGHPIFAGAALVFGDLTSPKPPLHRRLPPGEGGRPPKQIADCALFGRIRHESGSEIYPNSSFWRGNLNRLSSYYSALPKLTITPELLVDSIKRKLAKTIELTVLGCDG
jgi:hypothetical protein